MCKMDTTNPDIVDLLAKIQKQEQENGVLEETQCTLEDKLEQNKKCIQAKVALLWKCLHDVTEKGNNSMKERITSLCIK